MAIWLETKMLRRASAVVAVSPSWVKLLEKRVTEAGGRPRVTLIRNGQDLERVIPADVLAKPPKASPFVEAGAVHVHFNGTIQANNDVVENLLAALVELRRRAANIPAVAFTFCGIPTRLQERIAAMGLARCVVDVGRMSQVHSVLYSLGVDVLLIMVKPGGVDATGTIPAKTYEALALGKPILCIAPRNSDVAALVSEHPESIVVDPGDVRALADALTGFAARCARRGYNETPSARQMNLDKYSRRTQADEFLELAREVVSRRA
jgi:glycosyltransferase involved in cell wall biosynthesis